MKKRTTYLIMGIIVIAPWICGYFYFKSEEKKPEEVQTEIGNVHAGMPTFTNLNSEVKDVTIGTEADDEVGTTFTYRTLSRHDKELDELRKRIERLEKEKSK